MLTLECVPERQHSWRDPSGNKGTGGYHFSPPHLTISIGPSAGPSTVPPLTTPLLRPSSAPPPRFGGTVHPNQLPSVTALQAPSLRTLAQTPAHTTKLTLWEFCRASVLVAVATVLISEADQSLAS